MTGPAKGKIPLDVEVLFEDRKIKCDVYIHVKGFSRAYVTHIDIEGFNASGNRNRIPAVVIGGKNRITLILMEDIKIGKIRGRKLKILGLNLLPSGEKSGAYVGIKDGGLFVGFRKELVRFLEDIARDLEPELFQNENQTLSSYFK